MIDSTSEAAPALRRQARDLTPKQLEALELAHARGLYNTPRESTLDDIARALKISKAALHSRLRAAERMIITDFLDARKAGRVATLEAELARERARRGHGSTNPPPDQAEAPVRRTPTTQRDRTRPNITNESQREPPGADTAPPESAPTGGDVSRVRRWPP